MRTSSSVRWFNMLMPSALYTSSPGILVMGVFQWSRPFSLTLDPQKQSGRPVSAHPLAAWRRSAQLQARMKPRSERSARCCDEY